MTNFTFKCILQIQSIKNGIILSENGGGGETDKCRGLNFAEIM